MASHSRRAAHSSLPPARPPSNCDIKNLSRGSRLWLPVFVEGANLSMGDMHFSQGDGEVSFCGCALQAARTQP
jgi:formamidase